MKLGKTLLRSPFIQKSLGWSMARYIRFVWITSTIRQEPGDTMEYLGEKTPVIIALWHGQHFMIPMVRPRGLAFAVMISHHADAEVNAIAAELLGVKAIRASGAKKPQDILRKKGATGFRLALRALGEGISVALTADVPKGPAKIAGPGIILLAKHSGRPIIPVAFATSRNIDIASWDSASINLPFSRAGFVLGDPIIVPHDAGEDAITRYQLTLKQTLDRVTVRAYELAGAAPKFPIEAHS